VETRFLREADDGSWTFASYVWNDEQTDAVLAPEEGLPDVAEMRPAAGTASPR
jgi:hypothetical protein